MSTISTVNWSVYLGTNAPIAHDVTFIVYENENSRKISANKFILAAVSPVFREIFYRDNLTDVTLSNTTVNAVQAILEYVYACDPLFPVENIEHLDHILNTLTLAYKYEVQGLVDILQFKLSSFPLSPANVKEVAKSAAKFGRHGKDILSRCLHLSYNQSTLTTLVDLGKQTNNPGLVAGALSRLRCRVTEQNLWSMERLADLKDLFDGENEVFQASRDLLARCVEKLADLMIYRKKFVRITSDLSKEDELSYKSLMRLLDERFCENCKSASCKDGESVDDDVEKGTKVKLSSGQKGIVKGSVYNGKKIKSENKELVCTSPGTSAAPVLEDDYFTTIKLGILVDNVLVHPHLNEVFFDCKI